MKRRFWRFSRPAGSLVCLLLLLLLAWFLRIAGGPPPASPEAVLRRTERKCLQPPGELVEIYEFRFNAANAVTWQDGELSVYALQSEDDSTNRKWKHRYGNGFPVKLGQSGFSWGCCTTSFVEFDVNKGSMVTKRWFYVLVKNQDPRVTGGSLTVEARLEDFSRKWKAEAQRTNPYYLAFRLEINGGGENTQNLFNALCSGFGGQGTEGAALAEFRDADGNTVSSLQFSMIEEASTEERSTENGA